MEYGWIFTIFGLKLMVKSGLEKIFLKFLHAGDIFFQFILLHRIAQNYKFSNKNNHLPAWRKIDNNFFAIWTWPNQPVRAKKLSRFQIEGKNHVWISQVRCVMLISAVLFSTFWGVEFKVLPFQIKNHYEFPDINNVCGPFSILNFFESDWVNLCFVVLF